MTRRVLLIEPTAGPESAGAAAGARADAHADALAAALARAGAEVRRLALEGHAEAVLDAIEQGFMPVALKPPGRRRDTHDAHPLEDPR